LTFFILGRAFGEGPYEGHMVEPYNFYSSLDVIRSS